MYFVQAGDGGNVKIGFSTDVDRRLQDLSCGSAGERLRLIGLAEGVTVGYERDIHKRLAAWRVHREWFSPSSEVLAIANSHGEAAIQWQREQDELREVLRVGNRWLALDRQSG